MLSTTLLTSLTTSILDIYFLAQGGAPAGGDGGGGEGTGADPGAGDSGLGGILVPMVLIFGIFYLLIFRPESRRRKQREAMVRAAKKGDVVVTSAGIKGTVMKVDDGEVVLQIDKDKDVRVRFLKAAILEVLPDGAGKQDASDSTQREIEERNRR